MSDFDVEWYGDLYGNEGEESFCVMMGLWNGGGKYGVEGEIKGEKKEVFGIVGY